MKHYHSRLRARISGLACEPKTDPKDAGALFFWA